MDIKPVLVHKINGKRYFECISVLDELQKIVKEISFLYGGEIDRITVNDDIINSLTSYLYTTFTMSLMNDMQGKNEFMEMK